MPLVYFFTGLYPPPETANGVRIYYFVRELRRRGYDVVVFQLTPRTSGSSIRPGDHGEIVMSFPRISSFSRYLGILRSRLFEMTLRSSLGRGSRKPIIVSSWPPFESVDIGYKVAERLGSHFVVDIRDLADLYLGGDPINRLSRILYRSQYKLFRRASLVIATTEPSGEILRERLGGSRVVVIHNGADVSLYASHAHTLGKLDKDYIDIAFLGDLSWRYHMVDLIISSFARALRSPVGIRLRLKIIGEGPMRRRLASMVRRLGLGGRVMLTGYIGRETLVKELIGSSMVVTGRPLSSDAWNIVSIRSTIYEYMAAGLPIVAFGPSPSYTEYFIKLNRLGLYIDSNDPDYIGSSIAELATNLDKIDRVEIMRRAWRYDRRRLSEIFADYISNLSSSP